MERIPPIIHPSWHEHLQPLFDDNKMNLIRDQILCNPHLYYPSSENIFRVFAMPLDKIKVVIIGQDPYCTGEAIGKAFAVSESTPLPPSLRVIKDEIVNSKVERLTSVNIDSTKWRTLSHWSMQGVFLLNSALTVLKENSGSHLGIWQWFTREVILIISKEVSPVWLLWGAKAQGFNEVIRRGERLKTNDLLKTNDIIMAPHPAAEKYTKGTDRKTFSGCNHFNKCNAILKANNQTIINW